MLFQHLFQWIYCLPISQLLTLMLLATVLMLAVHHRFRHQRWWTAVVTLALLGGIFAVGYQTILSRVPGHFQAPIFIPFHSFLQVLQGGNPELLRSNLMNIILFYPLGLCTALLLSHWNASGWKLLLISVCFCGLSCAIEYAQIRYGLGLGELDDILHNTLGAFLGALIAIEYPIIVRRFSSRIPR